MSSVHPPAAPVLNEQLRAVLENMSEGLMLFDRAGDLIYQNPASLRIHGFDPADDGRMGHAKVTATWKAWDDTGRPITFEEWPVSRVFRLERFQDQVLRVLRVETGHEFYGSYNGSPIIGSDGKLELGFITIRDISAEVRAREQLRTSELHFRQLAESLPQLIWTARPDGTVEYYNTRIDQLAGARRLDDGTWQWQPMLHPDDVEPTTRAWTNAITTGIGYEMEHRVQGADGHYRWFLSRAFPLRDQSGQVVRWFGSATDIDEQKRAQEILERTVAERTARLRDTVAELEHFSYTITHDMRAPLRAMHTFAEILSEEYRPKLDATAADYLRRISTAAVRMDNLITDALSYAKAVQVELRLEPLDPGPFLRGIVDSYPQFQAPHATIRVGENLPPILANAAGFTQCVSNLLGNAVKFVPPGRQPVVNVTAETRGQMVRLWFSDNGIGIPPEQQQRIFGMFERLSAGYEGTGVGLALVRKVAEKMRGKVGVESEPGRGSRFWLEFQRAETGTGTAAAQSTAR